MGRKILLCGGNGAGKTTLGKALAALSGYTFRDTEDYYFPRQEDGYAYGKSRTKAQVAALLLRDLKQYEDFIFTSVVADFGEEVLSRFTHAVFVYVPREVRIARVKDRSFGKFGDRMRPGGDLFEKEQGFFQMVEARPPRQVEDWLETLSLPILQVDGLCPPEENARRILDFLG
ncbi:MAG: AAA family ATPase [Acutalibacter sp.]|nr:AAA family ATPase [Acutalibacter sp.]